MKYLEAGGEVENKQGPGLLAKCCIALLIIADYFIIYLLFIIVIIPDYWPSAAMPCWWIFHQIPAQIQLIFPLISFALYLGFCWN